MFLRTMSTSFFSSALLFITNEQNIWRVRTTNMFVVTHSSALPFFTNKQKKLACTSNKYDVINFFRCY